MPDVTELRINGTQLRINARAERSLLSVLRDDLHLTGAKFGCGEGQCGACTVLLDGVPTRSCMKSVSDNSPTTPSPEWSVAGRSASKVNGRSFVTGQHKYASDTKLPGLLHGALLRPPSFGATLVSIDTKEAEATPDVVVVRDGDFVGIAAPDEWLASRALQAVKAEWKSSPQISSKELFDHLKKPGGGGQGGRGGGGNRVGSMKEGLDTADIRLQQTYTIAYIAHTPLEPRAAEAQWENEKLTVWTGTQRPFGVRAELASAFRISEDNVRVIVPDTGSGYGGKHTGEAAIEASRLAKAAGKPVKLVWTREEEFTWAYFRPAGVIEVTSGVRLRSLPLAPRGIKA